MNLHHDREAFEELIIGAAKKAVISIMEEFNFPITNGKGLLYAD